MFLRKGIIKMKKLSEKEMRAVDGGRWKCVKSNCGHKSWTMFGAAIHAHSTGHYEKAKWCW